MKNYNYLSVLIPTYNEQQVIIKVIERVLKAVPEAEIIIVDDGSTDGTVSAVKNLKTPNVRLINTNKNKGKGNAVKEGVKFISRPITVQIDADLQFLPEDIPHLINPIVKDKADIVLGSRYLNPKKIEKHSVSVPKRIASLIASGLVSSICLRRYTDVFAGIKAWKSEVMRDIDLMIDNFGYEAEMIIVAKKKNYRVVETAVNYRRRLFGESKIKFARDIFLVSTAIFKTVFFRT